MFTLLRANSLILQQQEAISLRLFTISEYYDRDRSNYYKAIQSVRENDMDMTFWLEYFVNGLATQLQEVQNRGQQVIKLDILSIQHHLSKREKEYMFTGSW